MGRNNTGRQTALDEKKIRSAGRAARSGQHAPGQDAVHDAVSTGGVSGGHTRGAFGNGGGQSLWLDKRIKAPNREEAMKGSSSKTAKGMHSRGDRKQRGRTAISRPSTAPQTHPMNQEVAMTEVNRGVTANGNMNKHRGDRRDTNKTYTNNAKHAARGNSPRNDVSTRKR